MRLPIVAPYATADWPSKGPPRSFTVTLAADRFITVVFPKGTGGRAGPSPPSARRSGSFPSCRASGLFASALVPTTRRTLLLEAVRAVDGLVATRLERNACLATAVAACRGEHLALSATGPHELLATVATGQGLVCE